VRIAVFCPSYGDVGGIETIADALIAEFRRAGHAVVVLARDDRPTLRSAEDVPVVRLGFHQLPRRARHLSAQLRFARQFRSALAELHRTVAGFGGDVILSLAVTTYAPYVAGLGRTTPIVLSLQGGESRGEFTSRPRALRAALRRAARVVACAHSLAASAAHLEPGVTPRLTVVPNGVDPHRFAGGAIFAHPRPYVVAVGRLVRQKGFDVLIEAFARLRPTGVDLLLAGDGPERLALEEAGRRFGLAGRLHLLGARDPEAVASLYRGAVLAACPSRWEGLPVVCLEAMASGRAIVATTVDGIPDAVTDGETGLLVPPDDPVALAQALGRLLEDQTFRLRLGVAGQRVTAERFAWPRVASGYLDALTEATSDALRSP
jgi:glycosyltransferase involved in cell wall biosynthesis